MIPISLISAGSCVGRGIKVPGQSSCGPAAPPLCFDLEHATVL